METIPTFTPRELDLLNQVRQGLNQRQIASALTISSGTVKIHLKNIYAKIGRGPSGIPTNSMAALTAWIARNLPTQN